MFPVLPLGSYLLPLTSLNRYLNTGSDEKIFYCCIWEYMLHDQTWSMPNKYATLGFCHNSLNLVKVVWENALFWFVLHCIFTEERHESPFSNLKPMQCDLKPSSLISGLWHDSCHSFFSVNRSSVSTSVRH